ncbi:MAG: hypothetical protein ACI4AQ_08210 [Lachnospiraceae bacterium]
MRRVVVDTDYFKFITLQCTERDVFLEIIKELDVTPVMHQFVYEEELHKESFVKKLVDEGHIEILYYNDFLDTPEREKEYERLVRFAYVTMNGKALDVKHNIRKYHHEKENLGEIHSVSMARLMGYDLFMSNDGGARNFVENRLNSRKHHIKVMNVEDTLIYIVQNISTALKWGRIKNIVKQYKNTDYDTDKEKYERIREKYVK